MFAQAQKRASVYLLAMSIVQSDFDSKQGLLHCHGIPEGSRKRSNLTRRACYRTLGEGAPSNRHSRMSAMRRLCSNPGPTDCPGTMRVDGVGDLLVLVRLGAIVVFTGFQSEGERGAMGATAFPSMSSCLLSSATRLQEQCRSAWLTGQY